MTTDAAREGREEGGSDRQAPTRCMREASQKWTRSSLAVMIIGELMPQAPRGAHRHPYNCAASPWSFVSCSATFLGHFICENFPYVLAYKIAGLYRLLAPQPPTLHHNVSKSHAAPFRCCDSKSGLSASNQPGGSWCEQPGGSSCEQSRKCSCPQVVHTRESVLNTCSGS